MRQHGSVRKSTTAPLLWLLILGTFSSGCTVVKSGWRTVLVEPIAYSAKRDLHATEKRHRHLARCAWEAAEELMPECAASEDYRAGYLAGYADHLTRGGNGLPPLVAPRRYWKVHARSDLGRIASEAWFAGFWHGANDAQQSGLRTLATVPAPALLGPPAPFPVEPSYSSLGPEQLPLPASPERIGQPGEAVN